MVPRLVEFFSKGYARSRMIVKRFNFEITEQPAVGVMLVENFTEPVYQKIGAVRSLNLNSNSVVALDGGRIRNQMRERSGGILEYFFKRGAESFESHIGCVLEDMKKRHGILGGKIMGTVGRAAGMCSLSGCSSDPSSHHSGDARHWVVKRCEARPAHLKSQWQGQRRQKPCSAATA